MAGHRGSDKAEGAGNDCERHFILAPFTLRRSTAAVKASQFHRPRRAGREARPLETRGRSPQGRNRAAKETAIECPASPTQPRMAQVAGEHLLELKKNDLKVKTDKS